MILRQGYGVLPLAFDLPPAAMRVLFAVHELHAQGYDATTYDFLAVELETSRARVKKQVNALTREGLVETGRHRAGRGARVQLRLTRAGRDACSKAPNSARP